MSGLRAAELEILYTVNTEQVEKAEKDVKASGERIEKKPVTAKITADDTGALAGMRRVEEAFVKAAASSKRFNESGARAFLESGRTAGKTADDIERILVRSYGASEEAAREMAQATVGDLKAVGEQAKRLVSMDTKLKIDAKLEKTEADLARAKSRLEELQVMATAGLDVRADVGRAESQVSKLTGSLEGMRRAAASIELDADGQKALAEFGKVDAAAKRLVSQQYVTRIDADIKHAEGQVARFEVELDRLRRQPTSTKVIADIAKAESELKQVKGRVDDLKAERAVVEVEVDSSGVADEATAAGEDAGGNLFGGIVAALATIPIAGAVVGIAKSAGEAFVSEFQDALQVDAQQDRLGALTGIDEAAARRLGMLSSEAYGRGFGESIEKNMDTSRLALQFQLIDPQSSNRDSQKVIEGLSGIADALEEEVRPTAAAVATMLRTGIASSAQEAFDVLAAGTQNGVNLAEDMLDTYNEYPALFKKLGLSGSESMGLISQSLKAGARNSDFVADALKEFQIRATDASEGSAKGFQMLGLSATDMTAKIAKGGRFARAGLKEVLDELRDTEDPVKRNAAAVALFGTKAEDLGDALFAMDLSNAVDQLGQVEGAADRMFNRLRDNDASKMEQAQRNIEVAANGIKGALAAGFSEPLGDFSEWVSENRGPVMEFLAGLANGAIDFGVGMLESTAAGAEGLGEFVSGPLAAAIDGLVTVLDVANKFRAPWDQIDTSGMSDLADDMRGFKDTTSEVADTLRGPMVDGLEGARDQMNGFLDDATALAYVSDESRRLAKSVDKIGEAADGSQIAVKDLNLQNLELTGSGRALADQIGASSDALYRELAAARDAGEGQDALKKRYDEGREAMVQQLQQMGLSERQARRLVREYARIPGGKKTKIDSNAKEQTVVVEGLSYQIKKLPDGTSRIKLLGASEVYSELMTMQQRLREVTGDKQIRISTGKGGQGGTTMHAGGVLEFMANGGLRGISPMQPIAQMVPASTWRVVGDRGDVPEAYVPLDGSPRSWAILLEALSRMPGVAPMADGGVVGTSPAPAPSRGREAPLIGVVRFEQKPSRDDMSKLGKEVRRAAKGAGYAR